MISARTNADSGFIRSFRCVSLVLLIGTAAVHICVYLRVFEVPSFLSYPQLAIVVLYMIILPRLAEPRFGTNLRRFCAIVDFYAYLLCLALGAAFVLGLYHPEATVFGLRPFSAKDELAVQALSALLVSRALRGIRAQPHSTADLPSGVDNAQ